MIVALGLLVLLGLIVIVAVTTSVTIDDIRTIRQQRSMKKHPNARRWRERPTIFTASKPSKLVTKFYRKIVHTNDLSTADEGMILHIPDHTTLEKTAIITAVQRFNDDALLKTIAIPPVLTTPKTIMQLFRVYGTITKLPFDTLRSLFSIDAATGASLSRRDTERGSVSVYSALSLLMKSANFILFIYACYVAAIDTQPELLLIYLVAFNFWLVWTLGRYPHLTLVRKIAYMLVSPVSYIYFVYQIIAAPLRPSNGQHSGQGAIIKI